MSNKEQVLATLTDLFHRYGYSGTSLNRICAATGLGRGSIYYMFPGGKAQMLTEVLDAVMQRFSALVMQPLAQGDVPGMFAGIKEFYDHGNGTSLASLITLDTQGVVFRDRIQSHYATWRRELTATLIKQGMPRGRAAALGELTVASVEGSLVLTQTFEDGGAFARTLRSLEDQFA